MIIRREKLPVNWTGTYAWIRNWKIIHSSNNVDVNLHRPRNFYPLPWIHSPPEEDPDACARDGDAPREHGRRGLAQVELGLQVLGQEDDEAGHDDQLHASAQAGHDVDLESGHSRLRKWVSC